MQDLKDIGVSGMRRNGLLSALSLFVFCFILLYFMDNVQFDHLNLSVSEHLTVRSRM